jgi:flagellar capping protein FliD
MINKIEGIRRQLKKIIDKKFKLKNQEELEFDDTKVKNELKGVDKKAHDLKEQLEKAESKLRTSLKTKKQASKKGLIDDSDRAILERRKNSDDEEDEFYDRTK